MPRQRGPPTAAAIQGDIDGIVDRLSEGGRRGVLIGLSMGGILAVQALKRSKSGDLRALVDSAPARVPAIPFLLRCPRGMESARCRDAGRGPSAAASSTVPDDGWSKDPAARELMEKVKAGGGRAWLIGGGHVDLSSSGLAVRLPIYVDFVQERAP
jgi:alpha-beta hydrolase superfamily lysophospholipase